MLQSCGAADGGIAASAGEGRGDHGGDQSARPEGDGRPQGRAVRRYVDTIERGIGQSGLRLIFD